MPNIAPNGALSSVSCDRIIGWACDANDYNQALNVRLMTDTRFLGTLFAGYQHGGGVAAACGGNGRHGFSMAFPASMKNGIGYRFYAYALDIPSGKRHLLPGSGQLIRCGAPPTTPTPVCEPEPERCDGIDNDCDGLIDEECFEPTPTPTATPPPTARPTTTPTTPPGPGCQPPQVPSCSAGGTCSRDSYGRALPRLLVYISKQSNVTSYELQIATDRAFGNVIKSGTVNCASSPCMFDWKGLITRGGPLEGKGYYLRVRAVNSCGASGWFYL